MQISRRNALLGATAAAVVTGAATAPLAGVPTVAHADEPLLAMEQEWLTIRKEFQERNAWYSRVHDGLPAWARAGKDQHGREWGWPDVGDLSEFKSACKDGLSTRAALYEVHSFNKGAHLAAIEDPEKQAEVPGKRDKGLASEGHEPVAERREVGHSSHHAGGTIPTARSALTASMRRPLP